MKKIVVLGSFGYANNQLDGQTIKTRNVYNLLCERYDGKIKAIDTQDLRKKPWLLFGFIFHLISSKTLIIIPCLNNLTYIFPYTYYLSRIFRYDIIHICIGGWQVEYFLGGDRIFNKPHPLQLRQSKKIRAFMPEMVKVESDLKDLLAFKNTIMFPNFRFIDTKGSHKETASDTLRLVFLARIERSKGYETIFNFAKTIEKNSLNIHILFYGQITDVRKDDFLSLVDKHKSCVEYGGVLQQDEVTAKLVQQDVMLLPTKNYTEGFPGTVLDAYIAGIPVIATEWKHSHEFIDDKKTGFIIPFGDCQKEFEEKIMTLYNDRTLLSKMKKSAFEKRLLYSSDSAWNILSKYL